MTDESSSSRYTRVAAYGLIVRDDRMLLCRLSPVVKGYAGQWTLPGGGLDFGEAPTDALVREVREETGYEVTHSGLVDVDSICGQTSRGWMHSIRLLYRANVIGGDLRPEVHGSTDLVQWWPRDQLATAPLVDLARLGTRLAFGA